MFADRSDKIFVLDYVGKVFCFDLSGEKKLKQIQNLKQD